MTLLELTMKFDNKLDLFQILKSAELLGIPIPEDYSIQKHIVLLQDAGMFVGMDESIEIIALETGPAVVSKCGSCGGGVVR